MLKEIRNMIDQPVKLTLIGREHEHSAIEWMGGGIEECQSEKVLIFRGLDNHWLVVEWLYNGQTVVIPTADVICIASDIE